MTEKDRQAAESRRVVAEENREKATARIKRARSAFVYSTIIVLCSTLLLAVFTIGFTVYMSQRWCGLIVLLDDTNKAQPRQTDIQKQFAREISQIRKDFFC